MFKLKDGFLPDTLLSWFSGVPLPPKDAYMDPNPLQVYMFRSTTGDTSGRKCVITQCDLGTLDHNSQGPFTLDVNAHWEYNYGGETIAIPFTARWASALVNASFTVLSNRSESLFPFDGTETSDFRKKTIATLEPLFNAITEDLFKKAAVRGVENTPEIHDLPSGLSKADWPSISQYRVNDKAGNTLTMSFGPSALAEM